MSLLIVYNKYIVIYGNDKIVFYNSANNNVSEIKVPPLDQQPKNQDHQDVSKVSKISQQNQRITNVAFSKCGKYLAVCTQHKQLIIYNEELEAVKNFQTFRSVSKIRFTPSGNIILADKTGDVYYYKLQEDSEPVQLLGHLSMLLDVSVSNCENYIVTCDRDEKIRVSYFPQSYIIISYCLGHEEFVLNLEFFDKNILVSSSGDGTIRFWNYLTGKELFVIRTNKYINKSVIEKFASFMDSETVEVTSLPITNMKLSKFGDKTIIVVSLYNYGLQVYEVSEKLEENLIQTIKNNNILSFDLSDKLFILSSEDLRVYEFKDEFHLIEDSELTKFYNNYKNIVENVETENISVLYKRKYDNVQEYQERKKLRIENKK